MTAWSEAIKAQDDKIATRQEAIEKYTVKDGIGICPNCGEKHLRAWGGGEMGFDPPFDYARYGFKCESCGWRSKWYGKGDTPKKRPSKSYLRMLDHIDECQICGLKEAVAKIDFHGHHLKPMNIVENGRSGVEDGPLIKVCANCHTVIHALRKARYDAGMPTGTYSTEENRGEA